MDIFKKDNPALELQREHYLWLLDLMVTLPDIDDLNDHSKWELEQLAKRFGPMPLQWLLDSIEKRSAAFGTKDEDYKLVPTRHRLSAYVEKIASENAENPKIIRTVEHLLAFNDRKDTIGYILPRYAADIDPGGLLVPKLVTLHIQTCKAGNKGDLWSWTRFAGWFPINSQPWRAIATAAVVAAQNLMPREKNEIYASLLSNEIKTSSFSAGEMDPRPARELEERKNELQAEKDPLLMPFREWYLKAAQAEYDHTLAAYQEENEE